MQHPSQTRFGNLSDVFMGGKSPLLNAVARLSVLYEDFRIEVQAQLDERGIVGTAGHEYRVLYYLRRSLATLAEFRGCLTGLQQLAEFREAALSTLQADSINGAEAFFQQHHALIKDMRNHYGGHFKPGGIDFTTKMLKTEVGKISWNPNSTPDENPFACLNLDYAGSLVVGALVSMWPEEGIAGISAASQIIADSYIHVHGATLALVTAFIWNRFGR